MDTDHCGDAVQVVRRAVERIDDPANPARPRRRSAFLAEHRVVRAQRPEAGDDEFLRSTVHLGHEVARTRLRLDRHTGPVEAIEQERTRLGRDGQRYCEQLITADVSIHARGHRPSLGVS